MGQCIALYLVGVIEWVIVASSNWEYEVRKAFERMDSGERQEIGEAIPAPEDQTNGGVGSSANGIA